MSSSQEDGDRGARNAMSLVVQREEVEEIKREIKVIEGNIERLKALKEVLIKSLQSFPSDID